MNWTPPHIVVRAAEPDTLDEAIKLAQMAGLTVLDTAQSQTGANAADNNPWTLLVKPAALSLVRPDGLSVEIDFVRGKGARRASEASFQSQPLARALGLQKLRKRSSQTPTIIDATAGFGTDGWMMASLGCNVRLLEASPVLSTMLTHALTQALSQASNTSTNAKATHRQADQVSPAHSISVINTNSIEYLNQAGNSGADIIYLDPMYPNTRSKALVKKGMQLLHELIGPDNNGSALLDAALNKADYRVVVKRPRGAPSLAGVQSSNTRFDVYHSG